MKTSGRAGEKTCLPLCLGIGRVDAHREPTVHEAL
jgi:hypothetical protein